MKASKKAVVLGVVLIAVLTLSVMLAVAAQNKAINDRGQIAWMGVNRFGPDIYQYSDGVVTNVTRTKWVDEDYFDINQSGLIAFDGWDGNDWEIYLFDGRAVTQITDNYTDDRQPDINDLGHIVWHGVSMLNCQANFYGLREIFLYADGVITQITHNDYDDVVPVINNAGQIAWQGQYYNNGLKEEGSQALSSGDWEIFLYSDKVITMLTDNDDNDERPVISDEGNVAWQGMAPSNCVESVDIIVINGYNWEIFVYSDSVVTRVTNNYFDDKNPYINGVGQVVWMGGGYPNSYYTTQVNGMGYEIYLYELRFASKGVQQITDDRRDDYFPVISERGQIVWMTYDMKRDNWEIMSYLGGVITRITKSAYHDIYPDVNIDGQIAWMGGGYVEMGEEAADTQKIDTWEILLYDKGLQRITRNGFDDNTCLKCHIWD
jgi:hypothetical protein